MSFERALRENPPPAGQIGDVLLRYDPPVLIGETGRPPERALRTGQVLLGAGALFGLLCLGTLVAEGAMALSLALAAACSALLWAGLRADGGVMRGRRRFILHFGTETLRLDLPSSGARAFTRTLSFDDVADLYVLEAPDGTCALVVEARFSPGRPPTACVLVDGVTEVGRADLQRLWVTLRAAFGIRPASAEG